MAEAPPWLPEFYATLMLTGRAADAAEAVGISVAEAWRWRRESPDFAEYWDKSLDVYRCGALVALVAGPGRGALLQ